MKLSQTLTHTRKRLLLLAATSMLSLPAVAGAQGYNDSYRGNNNFYNGVRQGGHNGGYYHDDRGYQNDRGYNNGYHQGGIGPGKGALIGGAGGAAVGAIFGGGLKGALIGGGAGAGIGAIVGKEHQNNVRRDNGYYPR